MTLAAFLTTVILAVETSPDNPGFVHPATGASGPLQITDVCRRDINRFARRRFTYEDTFHMETALEMATLYINHYTEHYHYPNEPHTWATLWNGGPKGPVAKEGTPKKRNLDEYWRRCQLHM